MTRILKLRLMKNEKTNLAAAFARPRGTAGVTVATVSSIQISLEVATFLSC